MNNCFSCLYCEVISKELGYVSLNCTLLKLEMIIPEKPSGDCKDFVFKSPLSMLGKRYENL